ncbi:unnamed protein product [Diamesa hyperborea]
MAQFISLDKVLRYLFLGLIAVIFFVIVSAVVLSFYINFRGDLKKGSPYPSISLCQVFNNDKLIATSAELYGDTKINDYITETAFFTGGCHSCEQCETELKCPNVTEIVSNFRVKCNDLVQKCSWNGEEFQCCKGFLPLETDSGICYTINSALVHPRIGDKSPNYKHKYGELKINVLVDIQLFIHHPKDVPFTYQRRDLRDTIVVVFVLCNIYIKRALIIHSPFQGSIKETSVKVKKLQSNETSKACRSSWNPGFIAVYDVYSNSTCQVNCYHIAQVNTCNCTHHLMPRNPKLSVPVCDLKGLRCLSDNFVKISDERKMCKECMSPCEEYDYKIISNSLKSEPEKQNSDIVIEILSDIE